MSVLPTDRFILRSLPFVFQEDASGSCQVTYTVSNHSITKTKDLLSCSKPKSGFTSLNKASPLLSLWGAQLMLSRAIPKIFLQVGLDSHSQLPSASCTSLGWDSQTHPQSGKHQHPSGGSQGVEVVGAVKVLWVTPSPLLLSLLTWQLILPGKVEIQGCFLAFRLIGLGISLTGFCPA